MPQMYPPQSGATFQGPSGATYGPAYDANGVNIAVSDVAAAQAAGWYLTPLSSSSNIIWSNLTTTSVVGASSPYLLAAGARIFTLTANAGVTNAVVRIEGSQDGITWNTLGTIQAVSAGSGGIAIASPWPQVRANVISIAGGLVSVAVSGGVVAGALPSGWTATVNPTNAGVPVLSRYTAIQTGTPVGIPSSGSIGGATNGTLTLTTALYVTYPNVWLYFPANAVYPGSVAGLYACQMTSTTAGVVYNNVLSSTLPNPNNWPAVLTPVTGGYSVATAYTQSTAAFPALASANVLGGTMGPNGAVYFRAVFSSSSSANIKNNYCIFAGNNVAQQSLSTAGYQITGFDRSVHNRGVTNQQACFAPTGAGGGIGNETNNINLGPVVLTSADTTQTQQATLAANIQNAADFTILEWGLIEVVPA